MDEGKCQDQQDTVLLSHLRFLPEWTDDSRFLSVRDRRGQPGCMEYRFHGYSASRRYHPVQSEYALRHRSLSSFRVLLQDAPQRIHRYILHQGSTRVLRKVPGGPTRSHRSGRFDRKENAPEVFSPVLRRAFHWQRGRQNQWSCPLLYWPPGIPLPSERLPGPFSLR